MRMREYPTAAFRDVTAPNSDTLYNTAWLDVGKEPWILSLPKVDGRYYLFPMLDGWTSVFQVPGKRTTGTGPQKYAITGPGWRGALPSGVKQYESPTSIVWLLGRIYCTGTPEDYAAVHALENDSKLMIVAGGLSVGIGLGLQGVVNNFVSGLILLFERPIKVGDWVEVSSGQGYVRHIGPRATEIETFDRASIIIPNADLVTSAVQNWFHKNRIGRVRVAVGVGYGSDPERVRDILLDCAATNESVMTSPEPRVCWMDFGDSSLDFELRAYIGNYANALIIRSALRFAIFKALKDAGIEIPFPQRNLHIRSDDTKGDHPPA